MPDELIRVERRRIPRTNRRGHAVPLPAVGLGLGLGLVESMGAPVAAAQ